MLKGKKFGYLVYNFTAENSGEESFYKILTFYDPHGEIHDFGTTDNLLKGGSISEMRFHTKEELAKENLFIEVEKKKYPASLILKPLNSKNIRTI